MLASEVGDFDIEDNGAVGECDFSVVRAGKG